MRSVFAWSVNILMALVVFFTALPSHGQEDFLEPEKAFVFRASMATPASVQLGVAVAPGYYLYRERLSFTAVPTAAVALVQPALPDGEVKYDPIFDKNMEVYHLDLTVSMPLPASGESFTLNIAYQGCADAGLCYPPMTHQLVMAPGKEGWSIVAHGADGASPVATPRGRVGPQASQSLRHRLDSLFSGDRGQNGQNGQRGEARPGVAGGPPGVASQTNPLGPGYPSTPRALAPAPGADSTSQPSSAARAGTLSGLFSAGDLGLADAIGDLGLFKIALVFFGLGVLLALTPCVLPMVPILSALVVRDAAGVKPSRLRGAALAATYVAGMSVVYTIMGVAAGLSGVGLAAALQKPWVLSLFAVLLGLLALATFGAFSLQMPAAVQSRLSAAASRRPRGRLGGAVLMGAISALIVGPCVAAPLAGALIYISQTGDVVLGGLALFALAWGMGLPLLVVGATSTAWLPAAGPWMDGVNRLFGMLLLATAWFILAPILPMGVQMAGWGLLLLVAAMMLVGAGASRAMGAPLGTAALFARGVGLMLLLAGAAQVLGALSGGRDLLRPLGHWSVAGVSSGSGADGAPAVASGTGSERAAGLAYDDRPSQKAAFVRVNSLSALSQALAASDRPVMLDFYADWCVSCHEMERFTFTDQAVADRLAGMTLLQADVTANNAEDRALLKQFRLFGPPGIIFFDAQGQAVDAPRVIGFQNASRFTQSLDEALARYEASRSAGRAQ